MAAVAGRYETTDVMAVDTSNSVFAASAGYDSFVGYAGITTPPSPLVDPSWGLFDPLINFAVLDGELFRFTVDTRH